MFKNFFYIFHIVIIALFFVSCGYKADPKWIVKKDINKTQTEYNITKVKCNE